MTYTLYWGSGSPHAWRVQLGFAIKGLSYQSELLEFSTGALKTDAFLKINPRGKVPVLVDGGTVVTDSLAILAYLESKHPEPDLFGKTAQETGNIWRVICDLENFVRDPVYTIIRSLYRGQADVNSELIKDLAVTVHSELGTINNNLSGKHFLAGNKVSAADILLFPTIKSLERATGMEAAQPLELGFFPMAKPYPHIAQWMKRIEDMPGYDETYPPHWRD